MPYIKDEDRDPICNVIDYVISPISRQEKKAGACNYAITLLLDGVFDTFENPSYDKINTVMGILECVKQEYYRRIAIPYEEAKRRENGDVY